ncbi:MAG: DEAD/DEAH box helicase, partial [Leptospiraceae bacterium]|nr:DEAD/DEAH box helicase [Leptospiraceae bacterium]
MSTFAELSLSPTILKSLQDLGYVTPTPIQKATIPLVNAGRDVLGIAQTGTGKTAAFCLPIIEKLSREKIQSTPGHPRVLILTPTRELAIQIDENIQQYAKNLRITSAVIFGGVSQGRQVTALKKAPHI